jgi:imidazole glycerol-phosphate synthase subunit HisH
MITIIDYGLGNIMAFSNIFRKLNIPLQIASEEKDLISAEKIILPGVGSFDWAMKKLENSGMIDQLNNLVINENIPVIGICVGMQIMANKSEEGDKKGLGWMNAEVKKFENAKNMPLPHMGWNDVRPIKENPLFFNLEENSRFYFLHSYYFSHNHEKQILSQTNYNGCFTSAVSKENIFGVQFHPEKSHHWGVQLLKNFAELC